MIIKLKTFQGELVFGLMILSIIQGKEKFLEIVVLHCCCPSVPIGCADGMLDVSITNVMLKPLAHFDMKGNFSFVSVFVQLHVSLLILMGIL